MVMWVWKRIKRFPYGRSNLTILCRCFGCRICSELMKSLQPGYLYPESDHSEIGRLKVERVSKHLRRIARKKNCLFQALNIAFGAQPSTFKTRSSFTSFKHPFCSSIDGLPHALSNQPPLSSLISFGKKILFLDKKISS